MMKTPAYVVSWGSDLTGVVAHVYPTAAAARKALDGAVDFRDKSAYVIEREEDITLSGRALVDVFNRLTDSGVTRFESRATGIRRLFSVLPAVSRPGPDIQENETMIDDATNFQEEPHLDETFTLTNENQGQPEEPKTSKPKRVSSLFPINSKIASLMKERGYKITESKAEATTYSKEGAPSIEVAPWAKWSVKIGDELKEGKGAIKLEEALG
jgi:predicted HTH transcriptional regulator